MATLSYIHKNTVFNIDDDLDINIFIQSKEEFGVTRHQIKFSIRKSKDHDAWYLITSINPLKIFGGLAGTFENTLMDIFEPEEDIVAWVSNLTSKDIHSMAERAIIVRKQKDFYYTE